MQRLLICSLGFLSLLAVPARAQVFMVNTFTDTIDEDVNDGLCADLNGLCSLRAAIMQANALGGTTTIVLQSGTYVITRSGGAENGCERGDLDILDHLNIFGSAAGTTFIDGNGLDRVFDVWNGANVELRNLVISGGDPGIGSAPGSPSQHGGGIRVNNGNLLLLDVVVFGNRAFVPTGTASNGGGIYVGAGSLEMIGGAVIGNESSDGRGGGLYLGGSSRLEGVLIESNSSALAGGGASVPGSAVAQFDQVQVLSNTAGSGGGGLDGTGTIHFMDGEISNNVAGGSGGGIGATGQLTVERSRIAGNSAGMASGMGFGGGINRGGSGSLRVVDSTIEGNTCAGRGGGIMISAQGEILRSTISGNAAAIFVPPPGLTFGGGGIYNSTANGRLSVVNSTISYNTAAFGHGGGIANSEEGTLDLSLRPWASTARRWATASSTACPWCCRPP